MRRGSVMKLFTMFMTAPNSYYRNTIGAFRNIYSGRGNQAENAKRLVISHFILPVLFQFIASGFPGLFSDLDDKDKKRMIRALLIGSFNGLFILGDILESLAEAVFINKNMIGSIAEIPVLRPFDLLARGFIRLANLDEYAVEELLKVADNLAAGIGELTGVPYEPVRNIVKGAKDVISGDADSKIRAIGYSDYALGKEKTAADKSKDQYIDKMIYSKKEIADIRVEVREDKILAPDESEIVKMVQIYRKFGKDNKDVKYLTKAGRDNDDKVEYLYKRSKDYTKDQFASLYRDLRRVKVISGDLHNKYIGKYRETIQ
jgi:hypothetical protein